MVEMSEPSLAAQAAIRAVLVASGSVTSLVPAGNILDRNSRPEVTPLIIVGDGYTVDASAQCIEAWEVYSDIHVWTKEPGLAQCKTIAGAVQRALRGLDVEAQGYSLSIMAQDCRYFRDPDGEHAHAVVSVTLFAEEL
ncbi:DUF3168 domain-containing protein [Ancylobacter polymorphus]|uniref:DUF3168 domain-containing protein n=1 Tax=Ancylobacter polymorphus TaxID=223390 RepID=A0A9E7A6D0_9HYPH|nr:DUF3168 domain-containing protein [Ancylobacter polymorphus]UOK70269.1 DUF3168 domain-containing protein [Ancylobacter polymorphus]UOK70443.1 DUF3168 domain-containing protein [Ancylobacter polymorphus]